MSPHLTTSGTRKKKKLFKRDSIYFLLCLLLSCAKELKAGGQLDPKDGVMGHLNDTHPQQLRGKTTMLVALKKFFPSP